MMCLEFCCPPVLVPVYTQPSVYTQPVVISPIVTPQVRPWFDVRGFFNTPLRHPIADRYHHGRSVFQGPVVVPGNSLRGRVTPAFRNNRTTTAVNRVIPGQRAAIAAPRLVAPRAVVNRVSPQGMNRVTPGIRRGF